MFDKKKCIFCQIAAKHVGSEIVAENDETIIFKDRQPSAPTHWLIVPKKHTVTPEDTDKATLGEMVKYAADTAKKRGVGKNGYRLVINVGEDGGQVVLHLHLHLLAGTKIGGGDF